MDFRATIRKGRVTLVPEDHAMVDGGPLAVMTRAALPPDVSLAKLSFDEEEAGDERELDVEFLVNDTPFARRALKRWAAATRHARVWFGDEVYDPPELPLAQPEAVTHCPCCGLEMRDGSDSFWDMVVGCGFFPPYCFACGASVPQWEPELPQPSDPRQRRLRRISKLRQLQAGSADEPTD